MVLFPGRWPALAIALPATSMALTLIYAQGASPWYWVASVALSAPLALPLWVLGLGLVGVPAPIIWALIVAALIGGALVNVFILRALCLVCSELNARRSAAA